MKLIKRMDARRAQSRAPMLRYLIRRHVLLILLAGSLTFVGLFVPAAGTGERASAAAATATPTSTSSPCVGIWSPGYWKNYSNHYSDAQFQAWINETLNFQGLSISQATSIMGGSQGSYMAHLLAAELSAAAKTAGTKYAAATSAMR